MTPVDEPLAIRAGNAFSGTLDCCLDFNVIKTFCIVRSILFHVLLQPEFSSMGFRGFFFVVFVLHTIHVLFTYTLTYICKS